jgi:hypothetical protein
MQAVANEVSHVKPRQGPNARRNGMFLGVTTAENGRENIRNYVRALLVGVSFLFVHKLVQ